MKTFATAVLVASAAIAAPAFAAPTIGMVVVNPNSMTVGKVVALNADGTELTVRTRKHDIVLPVANLEEGKGRLIYSKTAFELDAEFEAAETLRTALDLGKPVFGKDGPQVGTIEAIDDKTITLALTDGQKIALPREGVGATETGAKMGWTADEFAAVVKQSLGQ